MKGRALTILVAASLAASACSGGSPDRGTDDAGTRSDRLVPVAAATADRLAAAAAVVGERLARHGLAVTVRVDGGELVTSAPIDPVVAEAAGRAGATELRAVTATEIGPCAPGSGGAPSVPAGRRCHTLGDRITGVEGVASASAELQPGIGWSVVVFADPARYGELRAALAPHAGTPVAVVADGAVVGVFTPAPALGQRNRLGAQLTEREARRLASALLAGTPSPVAFRPPELGEEAGPFADADFWLAALSANVCGTWLPDAPATPDASGIHSHGDGFVYAHPYDASEAGSNATLGRWLGHGSWRATDTELTLWDGAPHRNGDPCPDGRPGVVRWWVDGAERTGAPEKHEIGNGEAITLSFNPAGVDPGPPPAAARLPLPQLTPEA